MATCNCVILASFVSGPTGERKRERADKQYQEEQEETTDHTGVRNFKTSVGQQLFPLMQHISLKSCIWIFNWNCFNTTLNFFSKLCENMKPRCSALH